MQIFYILCFQKRFLAWRFLKTPASHLRVDGRKQRLSKAKIHVLASHMLFKGWYDIPIVLAFSCGHAKTIQIRYTWTRIFLKMEKKTSVSTNIGEYE